MTADKVEPARFAMTAPEARDVAVYVRARNNLEAQFAVVWQAAMKRLDLPPGAFKDADIDKCEWLAVAPPKEPQ